MMNLRGQGILQDTDIAYLWFDKAKGQGDYRAKWVIDHWSTLRNKYHKNSSETTDFYEDQTCVSSKWKK
jgi:TPR repeat protein